MPVGISMRKQDLESINETKLPSHHLRETIEAIAGPLPSPPLLPLTAK
jgi:hypothetical protein|tara:strand:- start:39416 stop:39559 length:144 start_codon:yes stop_codon:yes gene_type:complete